MEKNEKIIWWMGVIYDILIMIGVFIVLYSGYNGNNIVGQIGLWSGVLFFVFFILLNASKIIPSAYYYNKYSSPTCTESDNNKNCEYSTHFFMQSYRKYLTKPQPDPGQGRVFSDKEYDYKLLIVSESIIYLTILIYISLLYSISVLPPDTVVRNISILLYLLILVSTVGSIYYFWGNNDSYNNIQLFATCIIIILSIFLTFRHQDKLYLVSLPILIIYILIPRFWYNNEEKCSDRGKGIGCNPLNPLKCEWDSTINKCINVRDNSKGDDRDDGGGDDGGGDDGGGDDREPPPPPCSEYKDESECNSGNNCYYVKENLDRSEFSSEGITKVDSKTGCISEDNKCDDYSCNSEFYPLNIFDVCCNNELYKNGCTDDEIKSHLDDEKDILDKTKQDDSSIKTLYGQEAWSKKVDYDESYRYCESKNRRSEMEAGIYA